RILAHRRNAPGTYPSTEGEMTTPMAGPRPPRSQCLGPADALDAAALSGHYRFVRGRTEALCEPLACEDHVIQSMPDASPVKWHLAHTSWFFETFVLTPHVPGYRPFHPEFKWLFNSYYD